MLGHERSRRVQRPGHRVRGESVCRPMSVRERVLGLDDHTARRQRARPGGQLSVYHRVRRHRRDRCAIREGIVHFDIAILNCTPKTNDPWHISVLNGSHLKSTCQLESASSGSTIIASDNCERDLAVNCQSTDACPGVAENCASSESLGHCRAVSLATLKWCINA